MTSKKKRQRGTRAFLALAAILANKPRATQAYGVDHCAGTWDYELVSAGAPCMEFTNGITGTDVLHDLIVEEIPTCGSESDEPIEEYARVDGLDESTIATVVTVFDWVSAKFDNWGA